MAAHNGRETHPFLGLNRNGGILAPLCIVARPGGGMTFNVADARRVYGRARRALLAALVVALAMILSLPAIIYAARVPSIATGLSAVVAIGTFGALITLVRRVWLQLLIAIPILVLNVAEIVHILIYGSLISLGGIEAILHVDPRARDLSQRITGSFSSAFWCPGTGGCAIGSTTSVFAKG